MREFLKTMLPKNWPEILGWLILSIACALAGYLGFERINPPPPPAPFWQDQFGWVSDPEASEEVANEQPYLSFADTPAGKSQDALPKFAYLWHAEKLITGKNPRSKNQGSVGSCVSFGTNNAVHRTMAVQIAIFKAPEELLDIVEEVTYAGSRVEVGKGRISGDGSVGAWAAKFVKEWGVVARGKHGTFDLTEYDPSRCRAWGRTGVPPEVEALAKEHPVKEITLVTNWEQAKKALANGYAMAVCSNQGFDSKRDANGVKQPRGSWAHCMCLDGYHVTDDGKEYGHIENSWGARDSEGPVGWGDPASSGFWAEKTVIERMLRAKDTWAFSAVRGFPARQIDWFVLAPEKAKADGALYARLMNPVYEGRPKSKGYDHEFSDARSLALGFDRIELRGLRDWPGVFSPAREGESLAPVGEAKGASRGKSR